MIMNMLSYFTLSLLLLLTNSSGNSAAQSPGKNSDGWTGTLEKMIVANGNVTMDLDLDLLKGTRLVVQEQKRDTAHFNVAPNSFFTIRVLNGGLRGAEPGAMKLTSENSAVLPEPLSASSNQLVLEKLPSTQGFDLVVRDGKTGLVFLNMEGHVYEYDPVTRSLSINGGRLLISKEFANRLGRPADAGVIVGEISITATMVPIELTTFVNGDAISSKLPPLGGGGVRGREGSVAGPDIVVGDMFQLQQFGGSGAQVGLAMGTDACNNGDEEVHFFQLPNPDHPVISQNLYRMSGGPNNNERFEQIGQAWVKHAFGADQLDDCGFGCIPAPTFATLGVGCSDAYASSQNGSQTDHIGALGSRAWINPFTGALGGTHPESHAGHMHDGTSHRILVNAADLNIAMNPGATYYAEVQYDSPHEYAWCQAHPGQCNMYNNASCRRYNVTGTTSFTFEPVGYTAAMTPATDVWVGATPVRIEPAPGVDGRAFILYKVTQPSAGVWHYEYAIHNQNLDRSIQSVSVPLGTGVTVNNIGFHAPPNHPGFPNDGTVGDAGFSNTPWTSNQTADTLNWSSETIAQNPNANAIRFGTMYNFRFDSNRPPRVANATIGFFKTGKPITVEIQAPSAEGAATPTPVAQAINLSTRMRVQTGDNVGIGGLIITGSAPKQVLIRAIGPSLAGFGVPNVLSDPVLELHGPSPFVTITNDNWRDTQEAEIQATGIPPTNNLEAAIVATLSPGNYTAVVRGKNDTTGVALVEVYDLNPAVGTLANISTRAFVSTGENVVIAGFILGNNGGNDRVVVRGLGPSLAGVGVPNALANPIVELRDSNGALLVLSNDWLDDPAQAARITDAGLEPTDDRESALTATLPPGLYTAVLAGLATGTGVGVVEIYDLGP